MNIVLDASVVCKWFLPRETGGKQAEIYKERHIEGKLTVNVPILLFFEVANTLATKSKLSSKVAVEAISLLDQLGLKQHCLDLPKFFQAIKLSKKYQISVYDTAYLVLAQSLRCNFITADEKLFRKVCRLKFVKLLRKP